MVDKVHCFVKTCISEITGTSGQSLHASGIFRSAKLVFWMIKIDINYYRQQMTKSKDIICILHITTTGKSYFAVAAFPTAISRSECRPLFSDCALVDSICKLYFYNHQVIRFFPTVDNSDFTKENEDSKSISPLTLQRCRRYGRGDNFCWLKNL